MAGQVLDPSRLPSPPEAWFLGDGQVWGTSGLQPTAVLTAEQQALTGPEVTGTTERGRDGRAGGPGTEQGASTPLLEVLGGGSGPRKRAMDQRKQRKGPQTQAAAASSCSKWSFRFHLVPAGQRGKGK